MSVKFTDNSDEVLNSLEQAIKNAATAIGMTAEGYAKKETPVDTGRLRNSITHAEKGQDVYIGTNVEYAPFIELGARGRSAVHMLQRAATDHSEEYKQITEEAMQKE